MADTATITITSGPDRGKTYHLNDEMVNIGRGPENQVALSDPAVSDYQASILQRSGRFAIYAPPETLVEVDGSRIPAERWVWLPAVARIRLSDRTAFEFKCLVPQAGEGLRTRGPEGQEAGGQRPEARGQRAEGGQKAVGGGAVVAPPLPPPPSPSSRPKPRPGEKAPPPSRRAPRKATSVARFITDQGPETLVRLGEDGHLPELRLVEGQDRKSAEREARGSNPVVIYLAVGLSFVATIGMLLIDADAPGSTAQDRVQARREIQEFYGRPDEPLAPYQRLLREAELARSRNDRAAEQRAYRRVLDLLSAEDMVSSFAGLTGSREDDERLRRLIGTLVGGG